MQMAVILLIVIDTIRLIGSDANSGAVSDQELQAVVTLATELKDGTITWLQKFYPGLLRGPTGDNP
jgi:hypothetical protein